MSRKACIWDLDGTLLDSYGVIVPSLREVYAERGITLSEKEILEVAINESVAAFIKKMEAEHGLPFDELKPEYSRISAAKLGEIKAMRHAKETLDALNGKGVLNLVFTHRGVTTDRVLENTGLAGCFDDIVTRRNGFARKPNPEGLNYLIEKHGLDKRSTFYIGDRPIDIECASAAGIKSIMFIPKESVTKPTGKETFVVRDLLEIIDIIDSEASGHENE